MSKVLITAPLRQDIRIFREFQAGLDALEIPKGVTVDRYFVVNNCPEVVPEIHGAEFDVSDIDLEYIKTNNDHLWTLELMAAMSQLRNDTIRYALDRGYDYWFSVDTDIVLHPETLKALLEADKDIVSEIFWTKAPSGMWWCNGWMYDQCDFDGHLKEWVVPGLYRIGMTGACMLVKRKVLEAGVSYTQIPNIRTALRGEDRHFCIRAACAGFELWMDTHYPADHLYTNEVYEQYMRDKNGDS